MKPGWDPSIRDVFTRHRAQSVGFAVRALAAAGHADPDLAADVLVVFLGGIENRQVLAPAPPLTHDQLRQAFEHFLAVLVPAFPVA